VALEQSIFTEEQMSKWSCCAKDIEDTNEKLLNQVINETR